VVHEVVGPPLTSIEAGAALALGVVALLVSGVMPVLLGALAGEHRLSVSLIGVTATAEALTMGLAAALCGALIKPVGLRRIGLAAVVLLAGLNLATLWSAGLTIVGLRAVAGVAEGVLLWITIGMIARSTTPERWAGVYYALLSLCQFLLAALLATLVMPHWHANGGFAVCAVLILLSAPIALVGRDRYAAMPDGAACGAPPARGWVALAGTLLFAGAFNAVAIYAVPLALQAGLKPGMAGVAVAAYLATQVFGGALASALAGRVHYFAVLVATSLVALAGWAVFMFWPPAWLFVLAAMAVGFVYTIGMAFLVPMLIEADSTRRAAVQSGGAQLFGSALGPLLASRLVGGHSVHGVVVLAAGLLIAGLSIFGALHLTTRAPVESIA
jgi:MFS family permease